MNIIIYYNYQLSYWIGSFFIENISNLIMETKRKLKFMWEKENEMSIEFQISLENTEKLKQIKTINNK